MFSSIVYPLNIFLSPLLFVLLHILMFLTHTNLAIDYCTLSKKFLLELYNAITMCIKMLLHMDLYQKKETYMLLNWSILTIILKHKCLVLCREISKLGVLYTLLVWILYYQYYWDKNISRYLHILHIHSKFLQFILSG